MVLFGTALVKRNGRAYNTGIVPELPEVEAVAQGLRDSLVGRTITAAKVLWPRSVAPPDGSTGLAKAPDLFARRLAGQTITDVKRRGKWIAIALSSGDALLVHLRMTGRLAVEAGACLDDRYLRALFLLDDGKRLHFYDQRKFGRLHLTDNPAAVLGDLGPEPLAEDFTATRLQEMLARRRGHIKSLLLNQRFLAGLGNIYADETLWQARIHPLRRADSLTPAEVQRLHEAIRSVLRAAIAGGGTTLADETFRQPDGRPGEFAGRLAAYGRADQPCPRCSTTIERIKVSQRSTHFCPSCQPPAEENFKVQAIDSGKNLA